MFGGPPKVRKINPVISFSQFIIKRQVFENCTNLYYYVPPPFFLGGGVRGGECDVGCHYWRSYPSCHKCRQNGNPPNKMSTNNNSQFLKSSFHLIQIIMISLQTKDVLMYLLRTLISTLALIVQENTWC